jgi:hypothetical protein
METGRTVNSSLYKPGRFDSFHPHQAPLAQPGRGARLRSERFPVRIRGGAPRRRSPIWQRHQVESLEVAGSNPSVGTIGSVAQSAEATDSKPVPCGFDSHRSHHGEVTEPGKVPGCYPEASRLCTAAWVESHPLRHPPMPRGCRNSSRAGTRRSPAPANGPPGPADDLPAPAEGSPAPADEPPAPAEGSPAPADEPPAPARGSPG